MNAHDGSFFRRAHQDQRGQVYMVILVTLFLLLAVTAFVIDFGFTYNSFLELQASSDAAALAGAELLPNASAASTATLYSGVTGSMNANSNLPNVTMVSGYPQLLCLTTLTNQGMACVAPANANAVQVQQQANVGLTFARLFGVSSVTLTATSTASMRGSTPAPYNIVVIVDSTRSMTDSDGGSNCSGSRESCALAGVKTLLGTLSPCSAGLSSCVSLGGGQVQNPVDQVSLLTFPAVSSNTVADDYNCGSSTPSIQPYPLPTGPGYTPASTPTYQIVNFSSDYRTSDTASSLNTNSNIVVAVGGETGCAGIQAIGGEGTYYAGAIYSGESLLVAQQAANPGTQNALILVSDGDANAQSAALPGASTTSLVYPSTKQQCHQAITAAQWAAQQGVGGTKVYAVAYGAEASGCSTDTNPSITPCQTMQQIASSPAYFYTDYTSSAGGSCVSASQPTTNLNQIFTEIGSDLSFSRLIPNNTQ